MGAIAISADSHVVEAPCVFDGLADRFGDEAPRIQTTPRHVDAMVIPAKRRSSVGAVVIGIAGLRLRLGASVTRRPGHKPQVDDFEDAQVQSILKQGYAGLRRGLRKAAFRHEDQDADGVRGEVLYPSLFFEISPGALPRACGARRAAPGCASGCDSAPWSRSRAPRRGGCRARPGTGPGCLA